MLITSYRRPAATTVSINGKSVAIECTRSAARALAERPEPLILELELYFSCLVKKFVRFHDDAHGRSTVSATDKLQLYFRVVTSTACTMDVADRLGRQPESELDTVAAHKLAPTRVRIDFSKGGWRADFWM